MSMGPSEDRTDSGLLRCAAVCLRCWDIRIWFKIYICISFSFCGKVTDTGRGLASGIPRPRQLVAHVASDIERWPGDTRLHMAGESVRSNHIGRHSRTHNADAGHVGMLCAAGLYESNSKIYLFIS
jgi:hypothetical protein